MVFKFLATNVATMLAISLMYGILISHRHRNHNYLKILHGIFFGVAGLIVMADSYQFQTGIIFDCRSVILGGVGMFCGPLAAAIAIVITAVYRVWQGGAGAFMGVLVICASGLIGAIFYKLKINRPYLTNIIFLYFFGLIIHIVMLILMLALPWPAVIVVFKSIALPVLVLFPIGTVLLGKMLDDQEQKISAKQKIEDYNQKLKESQQHLKRAVTDCPFPIIIHAEDGEIIHISKVWSALTGYDMDEIKTVSQWTQKAYNEKRDAIEADISKLFELHESKHEGEFRITTKDGRIIVWDFCTVPIGSLPDGRRIIMSAATDITHRIEAEKELRDAKEKTEDINRYLELEIMFANKMAAKAEAANIAKSQFLANMSHEIRTPINAVVGFTEFLAEEDLAAKQKDYVNIIMEAGRNLLSLINDILDFSKIEAGKLNTEMINCSIHNMLNSVGNLMSPKAMEKGLELKILESENLPSMIKTDPTRLKQCLINLTNNAIKFTHKGHVHLRASLARVNGKDCIRFDIEDTGIGIAADKQSLIFEPFRQADGSNTRQYGGTGLGLTITRQLAVLLGGEITLSSKEGRGSVFSLIIPIIACSEQKEDISQIENANQKQSDKTDTSIFTGHALVAEDARTNQIFIKQLLEKLGLTVTVVEDGNQAIKISLTNKFDIIFMDMLMPNTNGYDATAAIRNAGIKTPIIAVTANAMKGDDRKCIDAGCDGYISKPFKQSDLRYMLNKYLTPTEIKEKPLV